MPLIYWLGVLSDLIPISAILLYYRRFDRIVKVAAAYLVVSAISDGIQLNSNELHIHNNFPLIHAYLLMSTIFFGIIYYRAFFSLFIKKVVLIVTGAVLVVAVINVIFIEQLFDYPSITNTALSVMLIVFSLMYFYQLLTRQDFVHIEKQPLFWINSSVLFYYSVTIFLFMLFKKLSVEQNASYFQINIVTNIIANILFTIGLLCKPENLKEPVGLR